MREQEPNTEAVLAAGIAATIKGLVKDGHNVYDVIDRVEQETTMPPAAIAALDRMGLLK